MSFALLTTPSKAVITPKIIADQPTVAETVNDGNEVILPEKQLYGSILNMTHYKSSGLKLIDYEDTDLLV